MDILGLTTNPWLTAAWMAAVFAIGYGLYRLCARLLTRRGHRTTWFGIGFTAVYALAVSTTVFCLQSQEVRRQLRLWSERMADPRDLESERLFAERMAALTTDPAVGERVTAALAYGIEDVDVDGCGGDDGNGGCGDGGMAQAAADSLTAYLKRHYFQNHWRGYHFFLTLCRPEEALQIDSAAVVPCLEFFSDKAARLGTATGFDGLYAISYGVEYYSYLYRIYLPAAQTEGCAADTAAGLYLFAEWGRPKINREADLPPAYAYAYYADNVLWSRRGHFLYDFDIRHKTTDTVATTATVALRFIRVDGYLHLVRRMPQNRLLVLTAPALKPTTLLYYFSFFLCLFFAAGLLPESLRRRKLFKAETYARRLQYTVFGLLTCAFSLLGGVSFFFIREIDRNEQTDRLKEKSLSALTALESRFMNLHPEDEREIRQAGAFVSELARVLSTDLYLFDRDGHFLNANRDADTAERPQPLCRQPFFPDLQSPNSHLLIRTEKHPVSLTAYAPFRNADNEILGYVMLPYDRNGRNWETVMQRYWGSFLNLFVWISLLTLLAAYLLSRYVTRPLKLLSRQMGALSLTENRLSAPPPLVWRSQDEIGALVEQYNRMTAQLSDSVRQLAEAERQNAWRQMARQVAHEIKNPLTPLQLQMQQLERAYTDGKPDFEQRLHRFADLLRTQIASLTHIADTFSQLAQWQQPQLQAVPLREAVESATALFPPPLACTVQIPADTTVSADPQWLRQILTNLLRNAAQAMEEAGTPHPHITIEASPDRTCLLLHVRDNGPGIAPERRERIFEPHFTTRSAGSGLGLAISRRLAEGMQGALTLAPAASASTSVPGSGSGTGTGTAPDAGAHFILRLPHA